MASIPKLTPRQRTFLDKLRELYREHKGPVHYSDLARRLGVNRFSAYDMLKVLEKKGVVSRSYALATEHAGPGRSMVVFAPTPQAEALLSLDEVFTANGEWSTVRERVLSKLRDAREANYREVLTDLLNRLPDASAPLEYCTQMVGALLLNMQRAKARAGALNPFRALTAFRADDTSELEALAGLSVGSTLTAEDEAGPSLTQRLLEHAHRYQASLSKLSTEARSNLAQFLEDALEALD
jgi:DNA-binding IclR family transcriptional regulator